MKNIVLFAALAALSTSMFAAGVSKDETAARKAVAASLKDPGSSKFGQFTTVSNDGCLTVNAKNAYGGYTGDQQALVSKIEGKWIVIGVEAWSHTACVDYQKKANRTQAEKDAEMQDWLKGKK